MKAKEIPVYLFTGFIEAGKSTFIQETLEDPAFNDGQSTLLLVCEEGEIEYEDEYLKKNRIVMEVIDGPEDFTTEKLQELEDKYQPEQVVIEYNGMLSIFTFFMNHTVPYPANSPIIAPAANCCTRVFNVSMNKTAKSTFSPDELPNVKAS